MGIFFVLLFALFLIGSVVAAVGSASGSQETAPQIGMAAGVVGVIAVIVFMIWIVT